MRLRCKRRNSRPLCRRVRERAGAWGARDEGGRLAARRKAQSVPHHFFSGRRRAGGEIRFRSGSGSRGRLRRALSGFAAGAAVGRCRASVRFCAAAFPHASFILPAHGILEAHVGFHSGRRSVVLAPRRHCSDSDGARRSAPGTAQGCRRGIVRPLRGQRGINQNMPSAMFFTSISPSSPMNTS